MHRFWLSAVLAFGLANAVAAQQSAQQQGPQAVIEAQIAAFLADDFTAAFAFASPGIQSIFGTPERFGQMVMQGYPMVHRPANLQFLGQGERGAAILQQVLVTDQSGRAHVLEYEMLPVADDFVINGVRILQGRGVGA